jgi:hypothetical protein
MSLFARLGQVLTHSSSASGTLTGLGSTSPTQERRRECVSHSLLLSLTHVCIFEFITIDQLIFSAIGFTLVLEMRVDCLFSCGSFLYFFFHFHSIFVLFYSCFRYYDSIAELFVKEWGVDFVKFDCSYVDFPMLYGNASMQEINLFAR